MRKVEKINSKLKKLRKQNDTINKKIELYEGKLFRIRDACILRKVVGKYFKFRNSYGVRDQWWLYIHCLKMTIIRDNAYYLISCIEKSPLELRYELKSINAPGILSESIEISKKDYKLYVSELKKQIKF